MASAIVKIRRAPHTCRHTANDSLVVAFVLRLPPMLANMPITRPFLRPGLSPQASSICQPLGRQSHANQYCLEGPKIPNRYEFAIGLGLCGVLEEARRLICRFRERPGKQGQYSRARPPPKSGCGS